MAVLAEAALDGATVSGGGVVDQRAERSRVFAVVVVDTLLACLGCLPWRGLSGVEGAGGGQGLGVGEVVCAPPTFLAPLILESLFETSLQLAVAVSSRLHFYLLLLSL